MKQPTPLQQPEIQQNVQPTPQTAPSNLPSQPRPVLRLNLNSNSPPAPRILPPNHHNRRNSPLPRNPPHHHRRRVHHTPAREDRLLRRPVRIGRGCVVGEKSVVGSPSAGDERSRSTPTGAGQSTTDASEREGKGATTIADSVTISSLSAIHPGSTVEEAAVIDTLATVGRRARIGVPFQGLRCVYCAGGRDS